MPRLEPENLRSLNQFYESRFLVDANGVVTRVQRLLVQIANPLDFRDFPFDRHDWRFTLWPTFSRSDEIVFENLPSLVRKNDVLSIQGWEVGPPRGETTITPRIARTGEFARYDVIVDLERDWTYYGWKLGLPLTLIVLMAYGVYFIPMTAIAQKIGLGMTSMLTLIAYMMALTGSLPKISYLTRADRFFVGSAILVFLGLVIAIVSVWLKQQDRDEEIERANRIGRWIYPVGMALNITIAFFS
jgi:hypothetical protein